MVKEIYDIKKLSIYLDISISEIRKLVREKRIPYFRLGNRIKFDLKKINSWLEDKEEIESRTMLLY
ncbi:MAG TPA: helix-turn-helix domain-containing protein [Bacilli bacterium]|nr:helix-turn-helix domain-containing protein [Bacilli bacterium]HPE15270.1 helix-turn-helix domain-containing protein [Bacilli bacterium]